MNLEEYRVISVDPSLRSTGVYRNWTGCTDTIDCAKYTHITALHVFGKMLARWCCGADVMLIEDYAFGKAGSSRSVLTMGEIRGIATYIAKHEGVSIFSVPIATWKAKMSGLPPKGRGKRDCETYCLLSGELFGRTFATPDEVDAYAIYWAVNKILRTQPEHKLAEEMRNVLLGGLHYESE